MGYFLEYDISEYLNTFVLHKLSNNGRRDLKEDDHINNVFHEDYIQRPNHELKRRFEALARMTRFKTNLKILCPINLTHQESPTSNPCIITERISSLTFEQWKTNSCHVPFFKSYFRPFLTFIKVIIFENLEGGLRVLKNKLVLVFRLRIMERQGCF